MSEVPLQEEARFYERGSSVGAPQMGGGSGESEHRFTLPCRSLAPTPFVCTLVLSVFLARGRVVWCWMQGAYPHTLFQVRPVSGGGQTDKTSSRLLDFVSPPRVQ